MAKIYMSCDLWFTKSSTKSALPFMAYLSFLKAQPGKKIASFGKFNSRTVLNLAIEYEQFLKMRHSLCAKSAFFILTKISLFQSEPDYLSSTSFRIMASTN